MADRIAVVGVGAIGGYFAAQWAAAGHDVLACARRSFTEYVVDSPVSPVRCVARVVTDPARVSEPYPWVVLAVKTNQSVGAAGWLERLCDTNTVVVAAQTGVDALERLQPLVGTATVLPAAVYCGAELLEPGHVAHAVNDLLLVPDTDAGRRFSAIGSVPGTRVKATDDFVTRAWRKLGSNVAVNGLTALTGRTTEVLRGEPMAAVARALVRECWTVAAAEGAELDPDEAEAFVGDIARVTPPVGSSMLYDRRAGRPVEHDAIYGAVTRGGRRHGIKTPITSAIAAILEAGG
jgi:2-dehydropantoate 2-reductase